MPLPSKFLFPSDLREGHALPNANKVQAAMDDLVATDGWANLCSAINEHVGVMTEHLLRSSDKDEQVRGKVEAYRDVMAFPALAKAKAQSVIDSQE